MANNMIATSSVWSSDERAMLIRLARLVIGKDPQGVKPDVEDDSIMSNLMVQIEGFERPVRKGLATLAEPSDRDGLSSVVEMTDENLTAALDSRSETRSLLRAMMQVVAQCYYQDERVLEALGSEARPPFPLGHVLEQGDWHLLDAVRRGPARYRECE